MAKIALVHDYIKEYGGAERVLETLHQMFPKAPVYTTVYLPKFLGPHQDRFRGWNIKPSLLQHIPFVSKLISPIRLVTPFVFRAMDFSEFDVVIVSATGAYSPNSINKGKAVQICYSHTPPRYLYGYPTARNWKKNPFFRVLGEIANHFLRMEDAGSSKNVDAFIANSNEVAARIEKFYRRSSKVIYPPVEVPKIKKLVSAKDRSYFLAGGRLARAKRPDLAIKACTKLGLPLKVFGRSFAGYGDELKRLAGPTVEFLGEVTEEEKWELFGGAKAYISPSQYEDFGMLNVEVMGTGTPVIAHASGGAKETIIDDKTGVFFDKFSTSSVIGAIKRFEKSKIKPENCRKRALKFSKERFVREIDKMIKKAVSS